MSELDGRYLYLSIVRDTARVCLPIFFICGSLLGALTSDSQKNLLWISDLKENGIGQNMTWEKLIDEFDAEYRMCDFHARHAAHFDV